MSETVTIWAVGTDYCNGGKPKTYSAQAIKGPKTYRLSARITDPAARHAFRFVTSFAHGRVDETEEEAVQRHYDAAIAAVEDAAVRLHEAQRNLAAASALRASVGRG